MSIWDVFAAPGSGHIDDNLDGKIACDSYHKYPEDVQVKFNYYNPEITIKNRSKFPHYILKNRLKKKHFVDACIMEIFQARQQIRNKKVFIFITADQEHGAEDIQILYCMDKDYT